MKFLQVLLLILFTTELESTSPELLDDLTDDEKALLEEEFKNIFQSGVDAISENSTDVEHVEHEEENGTEQDMGVSNMEAMQLAMSEMLDKLFMQAMQSNTLKEILKKRVAGKNVSEILGDSDDSKDEEEEDDPDEEQGTDNLEKDEL